MTHVSTGRGLTLGVCLLLAHAGVSMGQVFTSGSDETDRALDLTEYAPGSIVELDPVAMNLDPDGDRVFHFTFIKIPAGMTLRLRSSLLGEGRPVVFLATGSVEIEGTIDLSGFTGHSTTALATPAEAGAGGFSGGIGGKAAGTSASAGAGPGGGSAGGGLNGGGAGHFAPGSSLATNGAAGGAAYGNVFVMPALGGSGGGGGSASGANDGAGGGGGGGALVIASSDEIDIAGTIRANGGISGGGAGLRGGGGSGGSVRLIATSVTGAGAILVNGGSSASAAAGAPGRVRIETFNNTYSGSINPSAAVATVSGPGPVFLPANAPKVRVTAVGGVAVTATPTGSFVTPDVVINSATPVFLDVAAENIPPGTEVRITLVPENGASMTVTVTLTGTLASSTGTTSPVTIPHGFSRFFVAATWSPQ